MTLFATRQARTAKRKPRSYPVTPQLLVVRSGWRALAPEPDREITDWIEQHRYIAEGPLAGPWDNATFPLQVEVSRAVDDSGRWASVTVCAPPQCGKTEAGILNPLFFCLFHHHESAMYVTGSTVKAKAVYGLKLLPALKYSPTLSSEILEQAAGGTHELRRFKTGAPCHMVGADSPSALSSHTCPNIFCDEVDEYASNVGGRGHPADQAAKRARAFPEHRRRIVEASTPSTVEARIWRRLLAGTVSVPMVPCPGCGTYQVLTRLHNCPRADVPTTRLMFDDESVGNTDAEVWMECAADGCDHRIRPDELPTMLERFRWVAKGQQVDHAGNVTGTLQSREASFWWNAFYWPLESWAALANQYSEAIHDPDKAIDYQINVDTMARDSADDDPDRLTLADLETHVTDAHRADVIPEAADLVTVSVDPGGYNVHYTVRAWQIATGESWLVRASQVKTGVSKSAIPDATERDAAFASGIAAALEAIWQLDAAGWGIAGDHRMQAALVMVDGGYKTDTVGAFCQLRGGGRWRMTKGDGIRAIAPRAPLKAGKSYKFRTWQINSENAKHVLRTLLQRPRKQPGYWHEPSNANLRTYHQHMVAESLEPRTHRGKIVLRFINKHRHPNHYFDCEVGQLAAALYVGVKLPAMTQPAEPAKASLSGLFKRKRR